MTWSFIPARGSPVGLPPLAVPAPHAATSPSGTLSSSLLSGARLFVQPGLGNSGAEGHSLHLPCTKRNVKQLSEQIELHKGTLFSAIFLLDFRMAEECFLLFGAGCCGSVHAMSKGICQGSRQLQPLTKTSFMILEKGMG